MKKIGKNKLKIAQIAPLWYPVPPEKYGGIERIISFLTEGLTEKGHQVTLFASADSRTKAMLAPALVKKGIMTRPQGKWTEDWWNYLNHSIVFEKANQFDIIHCHWNFLGCYFQKLVKTPVIHTLHNIPNKKSSIWQVYDYYKKDVNAVFVSKSEKNNTPINIKHSYIVYNGIDLTAFQFQPKPADHFIWVARISPKKGIENAIKIAQKAKIKLIIAGQIQYQWQSYFNQKIKPALNHQIKFIGELNQKQISKFYGRAKALLYPIEWQEPFGLVMAESMACGAPVIGFAKGSVPEVVKHNKTGFVVNNIEQAVKAVKKIDQIKRADCRVWVEQNFTIDKMVANYEKIYYNVLKRQSL